MTSRPLRVFLFNRAWHPECNLRICPRREEANGYGAWAFDRDSSPADRLLSDPSSNDTRGFRRQCVPAFTENSREWWQNSVRCPYRVSFSGSSDHARVIKCLATTNRITTCKSTGEAKRCWPEFHVLGNNYMNRTAKTRNLERIWNEKPRHLAQPPRTRALLRSSQRQLRKPENFIPTCLQYA